MGKEEKKGTKFDCADSGFAGVADHLGKSSISDTPLEFARRGYSDPTRCTTPLSAPPGFVLCLLGIFPVRCILSDGLETWKCGIVQLYGSAVQNKLPVE
jgi:hypothetical protein